MSIENIIGKIEQDMEAAVEEILGEAEEKSESIKKEYNKAAENLREELKREAEKSGEEEEKRVIVNEQLRMRKSMLSKKQELLSYLYQEAKKKIAALPRDEYVALIKELILNRTISGSEEIIVPSGQGKIFDHKFVSELNESYKGGGNFSIADRKGDFDWGVILSEERRIVDLTLGVTFEQLKEKIEPEVARLLFPEEN